MAATLRVRLPGGVPDPIRELVVEYQRRRNDIVMVLAKKLATSSGGAPPTAKRLVAVGCDPGD